MHKFLCTHACRGTHNVFYVLTHILMVSWDDARGIGQWVLKLLKGFFPESIDSSQEATSKAGMHIVAGYHFS